MKAGTRILRLLSVAACLIAFGQTIWSAIATVEPIGRFHRIGIISPVLYGRLASFFGENMVICGCAVAAGLTCSFLSWRLRKCKDWLEWMVPPAFLSTFLVVSRCHGQLADAILFLLLAMSAMKGRSVRLIICDLAIIVLVMLHEVENTFPAILLSAMQIMALALIFVRTNWIVSVENREAPVSPLVNWSLRLSAMPIFVAMLVCGVALPIGYWIQSRFGMIPAWLIVEHMFESPNVLPARDIAYIAVVAVVALMTATASAWAFVIVCRKVFQLSCSTASICMAAAFYAVLINCAYGTFDKLDGWFSIRHEIACRRVKSDYFKNNFHFVEPSSIAFDGRKMNLLVIVSESLEERFVEGSVGGENLLPKLTRWRDNCFRADCQCQVSGSSFTSAALTSLFYGIPRLRLDGSVVNQDTGRYPRISVPSLWDAFLTNGYECAYVQGGDFVFASKGKLFPVCDGFRKLGFDDMRNDPDYLAEPSKHEFGVNDEVMFKYLKSEALRLAGSGKPFVLFGLTMNSHCPDGWCSAFSPKGNRCRLAESILAQDRMIAEFLDWFDKQECAKNTVVVVVGDHHYWGRNFAGKSPRRVFNAVRVPGAIKSPFARDRKFATFDWAPTFIELAGGKLPGDGHFGMGVSLLRDTETLLENISVEEFDSKMQSSLSDYWDIVLRNN